MAKTHHGNISPYFTEVKQAQPSDKIIPADKSG